MYSVKAVEFSDTHDIAEHISAESMEFSCFFYKKLMHSWVSHYYAEHNPEELNL